MGGIYYSERLISASIYSRVWDFLPGKRAYSNDDCDWNDFYWWLVTGFFLNHWGFRTLAIGGAISLILGLFFFRAAMAAPHIWRFALANF